VTTPLALFLGLKYFPRTFIGKRLILSDSFDRDRGYASYTSASYEGLVGSEGRAKTTLRPSGVAEIDGRKHSVVTAGEFIEQGAPVRVVRVEGSRVVVRRGAGDSGGTGAGRTDAGGTVQDQSEGRETGEGV
jgi:membrane-bound serine protease (ClpP class)